ncbi:MAG: hypothetical protein M3Y54_22245 [Bacteroidota bacterium]|nr:hypothetical protein [Bacteroidota bacterium]
MASFSAELRVAGHAFPVIQCAFGVEQATHQRGRVSTKVRYGPVQLTLAVPEGDDLLAWAAAPQKRQAAQVLFRDGDGGSVLETLSLPGAYCVSYHEQFASGNEQGGAYQCFLTLSDPDGWVLTAGGLAGAFVAPAARDHGVPAAASVPAAVPDSPPSDCSPAVTAMLQKQVELMCKPKGMPSKCFDTDTCSLLLQKIAMTEACIEARRTINNQCFKGGDPGHQQAILERQNGIRKCEAIYLRQCGSKPQPVPAPAPSTDASPSKQLDDGKYGPTTLAGAALNIFIILTAPFRTAPN